MNTTDIAYAAGSIDADGCITIKRTSQRLRNKGDCKSVCFSPRITLGQVTPQVPEFLRSSFGGCIYLTKPGTSNSRPMYKWMISDKSAAAAAEIILPFLKIKSRQAECVIRLQSLRNNHIERRISTWFVRENPNWMDEELLTTAEVMKILGYARHDLMAQAIANGTLITTHSGPHGRKAIPRVPKALVMLIANARTSTTGRGRRTPAAPQYTEMLGKIYNEIRQLNTIGINGTCVNHRTGKFTPA